MSIVGKVGLKWTRIGVEEKEFLSKRKAELASEDQTKGVSLWVNMLKEKQWKSIGE